MEKNEGFVSREKEKRAHIRFVNKRDKRHSIEHEKEI
jgi:hypothetical protein